MSTTVTNQAQPHFGAFDAMALMGMAASAIEVATRSLIDRPSEGGVTANSALIQCIRHLGTALELQVATFARAMEPAERARYEHAARMLEVSINTAIDALVESHMRQAHGYIPAKEKDPIA